jgi:hopene-associated glycosyltransferase HpnB
MSMAFLLGFVSFAIWLVLWLYHGGFWRTTIAPLPDPPRDWPAVVAVIPARNEAEGIGRTVESLLGQDYKGRVSVVVVDDESTDGTSGVARHAAEAAGAADRLTIVSGSPRPEGWTGKMWAVSQGLAKAAEIDPSARYVLLTDGDIAHGQRNVAHLVARAEGGALDLTSLMVRLRCESLAEHVLIPAFVFFFQMLYPFARVNDPANKTAGAAGGCMLVRRSALERIGGIAAIKQGGPIWLSLTNDAESLRIYGDFAEVWRMVSRSAYTQLNYSPLLLAGTVLGLFVTYLAPPLLVFFAHGWASFLGLLAWIVMMGCYVPMLRFYGRSLWWAPLLPVVAFVYLGATLDSALRHVQGKGGAWKGRFQAAR